MEDKFDFFKFDQYTNPFGIIFQPKAIEKALFDCVDQKEYSTEDLIQHGDIWLSLHHHSKFNNRDSKLVINDINKHIDQGHKTLKRASHIIITLGTSWAYRWKEDGSLVANCHKIPQAKFKKELLSSEQILQSLTKLINRIEDFNPDLKIIFTVSPVRHWKDGAVQNQLSKSTLILAIHQLKKIFDNVEYFPAYEIMMDDLRDYRFYADDMLHPSKVAVDYIWDLFSKTYFEDETIEIIKEVGKIIQAKNHRPFNSKTENHREILESQQNKIIQLKKKYSFLDFTAEEKYFSEK